MRVYIGKLKDFEVKLHIDESVVLVAQPARRIPFHLRRKVASELQRLEQQGIIEPVEGPTPWVSPLVVIPKENGEIRLFVDMREANKAILRERHPTPTVDDLIHALNGATVFSKLDLRSGYHKLSLAPESRYGTFSKKLNVLRVATDERTCKVRFTYMLIPTGYVRVVKFLEKVIIKRNADLKRPFKCKRNPETFFHDKSDIRWKDGPRQNPTRLI